MATAGPRTCTTRPCAYATRLADEALRELFDGVVLTGIGACSTPISAQQFLDVVGSSNLEITSVNFKQYVSISGECLGQPTVQEEMRERLANTATRIAERLKTETRASAADAAAMREILGRMASSMQEKFSQDCTTRVNLLQGVTFERTSGVFRFVNYLQVVDVVRQCLYNNTAITGLRDELAEVIQRTPAAQSMSAVSTVTTVGVVAIVALIGIGAVAWRGTSLLRDPVFWLALALPLLVLLLAIYIPEWPPYRPAEGAEGNQGWNRVILLLVIVFTLLDVAAIAALLVMRSRRE